MSQSDRPAVSIVRAVDCHSAEALLDPLKEACDLIGGLESLIMAGDTVLLKPNLVRPAHYTTGITTNPHLVEAAAILCRRAGAKRLVIADGACVGASTIEAFEQTGLTAVAERQRCELIDLANAPFEYVANPLAKKMKRIRIPKALLEANVVVNMPVMKTHDALEVSLGLKNMKGMLQTDDKKRFHKWGLVQSIIDLNHIVLPELTIMDGTIAMEGVGPTAGDPVNLGLILASKDTVAVDTVACEIMGFTLDEVGYVRKAGEAGLGCADLDAIEIEGMAVQDARRPFKRSEIDSELLAEYGIELYACDACSGCANAVQNFICHMAKQGKMEALRDTILLYGQSVEELPVEATAGKRVIRLGSCTRKLVGYEHYYPGCPPFLFAMLDELGIA